MGKKDQEQDFDIFFNMRNKNFERMGERWEAEHNVIPSLIQVVLFLCKYAKKQREKRGPIDPHPSIHHSRKQEKEPGVTKSL